MKSLRHLRVLVLGVVVASIIGGCSTTHIVEHERVLLDTVYQGTFFRDSIYIRDSVFTEFGDTVRIEKWRYKFISQVVYDTIYKARIDTVYRECEVVAPLTLSQRFKLNSYWILVLLLVVATGVILCIKVFKIF